MENAVAYISETDAPTDRPCEIFDARDLPPPAPLKNTLEQLSEFDDSVILVQQNDRPPKHLYPELDDRGYEYETIESSDGVVTVIWKQ